MSEIKALVDKKDNNLCSPQCSGYMLMNMGGDCYMQACRYFPHPNDEKLPVDLGWYPSPPKRCKACLEGEH